MREARPPISLSSSVLKKRTLGEATTTSLVLFLLAFQNKENEGRPCQPHRHWGVGASSALPAGRLLARRGLRQPASGNGGSNTSPLVVFFKIEEDLGEAITSPQRPQASGGQRRITGDDGWRSGGMKKLETEVEQYSRTSFPNEFLWELNDKNPEEYLPLMNGLRGTQLLHSILDHPAF
ncbi:Tetrapyrrole-binding protein [Nymphaea thermarum]|nr:Tetrapyrrole-binding protein [Nymphaea thermarum]